MVSKSLIILSFLYLFHSELKGQEKFIFNEDSFLGFTIGYSPNSVIFLGKTPDTQTTLLQFNYGTKLEWEVKGIPVFYVISITPYIHFDYPKRDRDGIKDIAKGFGFSPVGFKITKPLKNNFGVSINTSGGIMVIDKNFPTDKGRKLNFTYELSPSIFMQTQNSISFLLGYKFHHISNAQTGSENPGIDSNFIFISTQISI